MQPSAVDKAALLYVCKQESLHVVADTQSGQLNKMRPSTQTRNKTKQTSNRWHKHTAAAGVTQRICQTVCTEKQLYSSRQHMQSSSQLVQGTAYTETRFVLHSPIRSKKPPGARSHSTTHLVLISHTIT